MADKNHREHKDGTPYSRCISCGWIERSVYESDANWVAIIRRIGVGLCVNCARGRKDLLKLAKLAQTPEANKKTAWCLAYRQGRKRPDWTVPWRERT